MDRKISVVSAIVFASIASLVVKQIMLAPERGSRLTATVSRVIDGDTIELANGDRVRLLGIDAPEKGSYYYEEVRDRLRQLIGGKTVELERDKSDKDQFGRLLRYVFVGGEFVNLKLVEEGCAYAYVVAPDEKYKAELVKAEQRARRQGLLIWETSSQSDCIAVRLHYNARGKDDENLNDEYVEFSNLCKRTVDMSGWLVKDESANSYIFPKFILHGGSTATLYSGCGKDTDAKLYWCSSKPIWNNKGDTLYLRDADGKLILKKSYRN